MNQYSKVLIIGSGGTQIGESADLHIALHMAIDTYKKLGLTVVVIEPNTLRVQTHTIQPDAQYYTPITTEHIRRIIDSEQPDALYISCGGEVAEECLLELHALGILEQKNITVLGTTPADIAYLRDRSEWTSILKSHAIDTPNVVRCESTDEAIIASHGLQCPIVLHSTHTYSRQGSMLALHKEEIEPLSKLLFARASHIFLEEDYAHWRGVSLHILSDIQGNKKVVQILEQVESSGIHPRDAIQVTPPQAISAADIENLTNIAHTILETMNIIGFCSIYFAFQPKTHQYKVIDITLQFSFHAAFIQHTSGVNMCTIEPLLCLGYTLYTLPDFAKPKTVVQSPYIAISMPQWDLESFAHTDTLLDANMKSTGEIMSFGTTFCEALHNGLAMVYNSLSHGFAHIAQERDLKAALRKPTPDRFIYICSALQSGWSAEEVAIITGIDLFFIQDIEASSTVYNELKRQGKFKITKNLLLQAKQLGMATTSIAQALETSEQDILELYTTHSIYPYLHAVESHRTVYFYSYCLPHSILDTQIEVTVAIFGHGPHMIGQGAQYDVYATEMMQSISKTDISTLYIQCNPSTIGSFITDTWIICALLPEFIRHISNQFIHATFVTETAGKYAYAVAKICSEYNIPMFGTSFDSLKTICNASDLHTMIDASEVEQPSWKKIQSIESALEYIQVIGYPILVKPSRYVAHEKQHILYTEKDVHDYIVEQKKKQILEWIITKYEYNVRTFSTYTLVKSGEVQLVVHSEHIENTGVHTGDSTLIIPPQRIAIELLNSAKKIIKKLTTALQITGVFQVQFIVKNNQLKVITCSVHSLELCLFISKTIHTSIAALHMQLLTNQVIQIQSITTLELPFVAIRAPQHSIHHLRNADPYTTIRMHSTGEVCAFAENTHQALLLAQQAADFIVPEKNVLVSLGGLDNKIELFSAIKQLHMMGYNLYATKNTHDFLLSRSIESVLLFKPSEPRNPNTREYLERQRIHLVIAIPSHYTTSQKTDGYFIRRLAIDYNIPLFTNTTLAKRCIEAIDNEKTSTIPLSSWSHIYQL